MSEPRAGVEQASPAVGPVRLADALGWGSSVLGAPMVLAPRRLLRAIGVTDDPQAVRWTLIVGVREHLATLNVIAMRQRRIGMWSRVAGDTMDLTLLAAAHRHKRADAGRLRAATAIVAALYALDIYTAVQLARADGQGVRDGSGSSGEGAHHDTGGSATRVRTAITVRRSPDELRSAFLEHEFSALDPAALLASGAVRIVPAPGDRGAELHLDHDPGGRGGALGATAAKLAGKAPDQVINDELRRFKSLVETGVLARSETSPEGPSATRQLFHKRQPAQPAGKEA